MTLVWSFYENIKIHLFDINVHITIQNDLINKS